MKPYKCVLCEKEFDQKSHYNKHKSKKYPRVTHEKLINKIKTKGINKCL